MRTSFFVAKSLFVVPAYMFLGDHEEAKIVQWLTKDKASFFKQQRASVQPSKTPVLTAEERQEVEECTKIFQQMNQLDEQDTADIGTLAWNLIFCLIVLDKEASMLLLLMFSRLDSTHK